MKTPKNKRLYLATWYIKNKPRILKRNSLHYKKNKLEILKKNKLYRIKNKKLIYIRNRNWKLKKYYNLTYDEYLQKLKKQKNKCEICGKKNKRKSKNSFYKLALDHNHKTGKVRGLLCHPCNLMIGLIKEKYSTLYNIIKYLKKHK